MLNSGDRIQAGSRKKFPDGSSARAERRLRLHIDGLALLLGVYRAPGRLRRKDSTPVQSSGCHLQHETQPFPLRHPRGGNFRVAGAPANCGVGSQTLARIVACGQMKTHLRHWMQMDSFQTGISKAEFSLLKLRRAQSEMCHRAERRSQASHHLRPQASWPSKASRTNNKGAIQQSAAGIRRCRSPV